MGTPTTPALSALRLLAGGRVNEAIASFEEVLRDQPKDEAALIGLCRAFLASGKLEQAGPALERLLEAHPNHREGSSHLALLRAHHGDPGALQTLQALSDAPGAGFLEHYNLGTALLARNDLAGAEVATRRALAVEPENPSAHMRLGQLALERRNPRPASEHFERVVARLPGEVQGWVMLARSRAAAGEWEQALQTLERALERHRQSVPVLEDLHAMALRAGDGRRALRAAMDLRQRDPKSVDAAYRFGTAALMTGLLAQAREGFALAVELAPDAPRPRQALAKVLSAMGQQERAAEELQQALKLAPGQPDLANDLATLWLRQSAPAKAEPLLRGALEQHPDDAGLHLNLALALSLLGRGREALPHARQAAAAKDLDLASQGARLAAQLEKAPRGKAA